MTSGTPPPPCASPTARSASPSSAEFSDPRILPTGKTHSPDSPGFGTWCGPPARYTTTPRCSPTGIFRGQPMRTTNEFALAASPVQFDEAPLTPTQAPGHGEHTDLLLAELGFG